MKGWNNQINRLEEFKWIVITGGVSSGIGKGCLTASLAYLLDLNGFDISPIKFDGLLNYSIESIAPYKEKPEVVWSGEEIFVLDDGSQVDKDLGVYERFLDKELSAKSSIINGEVWEELFEKQRKKEFLVGEAIKIKPHLIYCYEEKLLESIADSQVGLIEVGGTIGDLESEYFLETLKKIKFRNPSNLLSVHLTYIPYEGRGNLEEEDFLRIHDSYMLKPAKQSMNKISEKGLHPDLVFCRSKVGLTNGMKERLSQATLVPKDNFFWDPDVDDIYELPAALQRQKVDRSILKWLGRDNLRMKRDVLEQYSRKKRDLTREIRIVIDGSGESVDSFVSLNEAVEHSSTYLGLHPKIKWVRGKNDLSFDGLIVAEGSKINEESLGTPVLGISDGAYAIIEKICHIDKEIVAPKRGFRCGGFETIFGREMSLRERHRHEREILSTELKKLQGFQVSGVSTNIEGVVDVYEIPERRIIGVQYHPEYTSRPNQPNPLITYFLKKCLGSEESLIKSLRELRNDE